MSSTPLAMPFQSLYPAEPLVRLGRTCAMGSMAAAALLLLGWAFDLGLPRRPPTGWIAMPLWTAICAILAGLGLLLSTIEATPLRQTVKAMTVVGLVAIPGTTLLIDLLAAMPGIANPAGARTLAYLLPSGSTMAPATALEFLLLVPLLLLTSRGSRAADLAYAWVAGIGALLASLVLIGHAYMAQTLQSAGLFDGVAVSAAATVLILFLGFFLIRPELGWVRLLRSRCLGGICARRMLPIVLVVPLAFGWVLALLLGVFEWPRGLGLALFVATIVPLLLAIVLAITRQLSRIDLERQGVEEENRRHLQRLALAQEVSGAGAWDWDLTTGQCTWSDSYFQLFGIDPSEGASHEAFFARVHPEDAPGLQALLDEVLAGRDSFHCEYRIVRPDGVLRHMATLGKVYRNGSGRADRVTGLNLDISERVEASDALRAAKLEAERASMAKSRFLAAASHDLRQPVQGLVLFAGALHGWEHSKQATKAIEGINRSVEALTLLLDSLLDISKLDAAMVEPKLAAVPLHPLLHRLEDEYAPRAVAAGLRLRAVATSAAVRADPLLLERMLRNLIENALRYTSAGGVVIGARCHAGRVMIQVVDSGIGIARDEQQAVFEEFYQSGNPERDRSKGLGLGLAIVARLARLMTAQVTLRSRPGRGSCFTIDLPVAVDQPDAVVAPPEPPATPPTGGHNLVMVIEDDELVRSGLDAALTGWGYDVTTAASTEEAVATLGRLAKRPALVIADYRLRGTEVGTGAIDALRQRCGTDIPALLITGDIAPERLKEVQSRGFVLVHKPIAGDALRKLVAALTHSP